MRAPRCIVNIGAEPHMRILAYESVKTRIRAAVCMSERSSDGSPHKKGLSSPHKAAEKQQNVVMRLPISRRRFTAAKRKIP